MLFYIFLSDHHQSCKVFQKSNCIKIITKIKQLVKRLLEKSQPDPTVELKDMIDIVKLNNI